jgi:hypothetical protein
MDDSEEFLSRTLAVDAHNVKVSMEGKGRVGQERAEKGDQLTSTIVNFCICLFKNQLAAFPSLPFPSSVIYLLFPSPFLLFFPFSPLLPPSPGPSFLYSHPNPYPSPSPSPQALSRYAYVLCETGRAQCALARVTLALSLSPDNPDLIAQVRTTSCTYCQSHSMF